MKYIEQVKNVFDHWALSGKADQIEAGHTFSVSEMLKQVTIKNFSFLDVGCGNGWAVRKIIESWKGCKHAYGIDVSSEMIKLANKRKENDKEHYVCADFSNWDYEEKFDIVLSMEALYYMKPIKNVLNRLFDILKDDGLLLVGMDFYKENKVSKQWPELIGLDMQLESIKEWKNLLCKTGFKNIHITQIRNKNSDEEWKRRMGTLAMYAAK